MVQEMVHSTGLTTVEENNSWRFGNMQDGTVSVTLDMSLFENAAKEKKDEYLTGVSDKATTVYLRSGIPLAKITASGEYGPYDPEASDGRQEKIAGLLESMIEVNITLAGWDVADPNVGMRYRGDIVKANLPVAVDDDAVWGGDFYDVEDDVVTYLSAAPAAGAGA
ncbi:K structural protein [Bifidobacterium magnum]|uniref:Bacteriophage lambda head decoration like-protein n=1 Tax=Bifidobacterium magnum TaxID=1692 RepID=A0A087B687_9BIFI|nr:K structural protein [Bifidobacterium magnum]KFI66537.1 Bacteriophage lambda head decoration like-protein [Bifidobacterium magnum]